MGRERRPNLDVPYFENFDLRLSNTVLIKKTLVSHWKIYNGDAITKVLNFNHVRVYDMNLCVCVCNTCMIVCVYVCVYK